MDFRIFLKGLVIGFSIAAPVGPIGLLCIQRTLEKGRATGLVSGLGAATADAVYAMIAGFGLTFLSNFILGSQFWIRVIGGIFLCYLGLKIFFSNPSEKTTSTSIPSLGRAYSSTLFLTLTNPATILSFTAVFAGLGITSSHPNYLSSSLMVLGVFLGSTFWWMLLSTVIAFLQFKFQSITFHWVNYFSGIIILVFGILAFLSLYY